MKKLKGFTLTELMVALAVIGILVAVVTPTVMKTRPNKNKMMVKKTFYTIEQVVSTLINDERLYPDKRDMCYSASATDADCYWGFDWREAVNFEGETYENDKKFVGLFKSRLNIKSTEDDFKFTTSDGVSWDFTNATFGAHQGKVTSGLVYNDYIIVDVNGSVEGPNCAQSTSSSCDPDDFDRYKVELLPTGKLRIDEDDVKAIEYVTINTSVRN